MPPIFDDVVKWSKHWRPSGWIEREIGRIGEGRFGFTTSRSYARVQLFRARTREGPLRVRLVFAGKQTLNLSKENAFRLADYLIRAADEIDDGLTPRSSGPSPVPGSVR